MRCVVYVEAVVDCRLLQVGRMGGQWKTTDFLAGDVLCFKMHTLHMSTTNVTDRVRISCDVRWQPADEPMDPRYVGEIDIASFTKAGLYSDDGDKGEVEKATVTMSELKRQWGFETSSPNSTENQIA